MAESDTTLSDEIASAAKTAETAAAASTQQTTDTTKAADTIVAAEDKYKGWIPPDAHERIVDGFHKRVDELAWARGLDPAEVREALELRRQTTTRDAAGAEPKPDVLDEHKQQYYSPQQAAKWAEWKATTIVNERMQELESRLGPIEARNRESERLQSLNDQIANARTLPKFADHVEDITAWLREANQRRARGEDLPVYSIRDAYDAVVLPKLASDRETLIADEKKKWLAELNKTSEIVKDDLHPGKGPAATRADLGKMSIAEATKAAFAGAGR